MAQGNISRNEVLIENLGTQKIYDYNFASTTSVGFHYLYTQNSPDSPFVGNVTYAILNKVNENGEYSQVLLWGSGNIYCSQVIVSSTPSIVWYKANVTLVN